MRRFGKDFRDLSRAVTYRLETPDSSEYDMPRDLSSIISQVMPVLKCAFHVES
jgi:hypothetical protein